MLVCTLRTTAFPLSLSLMSSTCLQWIYSSSASKLSLHHEEGLVHMYSRVSIFISYASSTLFCDLYIYYLWLQMLYASFNTNSLLHCVFHILLWLVVLYCPSTQLELWRRLRTTFESTTDGGSIAFISIMLPPFPTSSQKQIFVVGYS